MYKNLNFINLYNELKQNCNGFTQLGFINHLTNTYQRNLIEKYLIKYKTLIKDNIIDIGSKNRRYDYLFKGNITAIDIFPNPEYNIIKGDLKNLEFPSKTFDSALCLEVFTYLDVDDIKKGFNEIYRVLKKNGIAFISLGYIYHENDENFRLTRDYISKILTGFPNLKFKILRVGNRFTSIYDIIRERIKKKKKKIKNLGPLLVCFVLYLIIKIFGLENKEDGWPEGYFIILTKKQ